MHSSRMRTDRWLTVCLLARGESIQGASGGRGLHPERGASWMHPPNMNRMTHDCENITFRSIRSVKIRIRVQFHLEENEIGIAFFVLYYLM